MRVIAANQRPFPRWFRRWRWAWLLSGALLFLALYGLLADFSPLALARGPIVATDINQHRANAELPPPQAGVVLRQTFVPGWDNLREIELLVAQTGADGGNGRFRLQLFDDAETLIAEQDLTADMFVAGQTHTFRFAPQPASAGRTYTLAIGGDAANTASVRGYTLDVYRRGELTIAGGALSDAAPETAVQDLRFITRYELGWENALGYLGGVLYFDGLYLLLALFFLPLPGVLVLQLGPAAWRRWDPLAWLGVALALGISIWALLWFGLTLLGGRMTGWLLWLLFGVGWTAVVGLWWRGRKADVAGWRWRGAHLWLLALLIVAVAVRLLAVRHINVLPWVDASRHALITAVMVETGQTMRDYGSYLPIGTFPYHFGFHTLTASLHLMTGWELNYMLLYLGQLLNGLAALGVYTAVWLATRRQGAGLLAAFLVALPFFLPGYYASWGRLTQLAGMLILPPLLGLTWRLVRGARGQRRVWWLVGLLAAGLFLVHFRVFVYYLPFALVVWLTALGRNGRWLAAAAAWTVALTVWRIPELAAAFNPAVLQRNPSPISNYNSFPVSYLQTGWEWDFVYLAGTAFIIVVLSRLWRQRWSVWPQALFLWVGVTFIALGGERVGLPAPGYVNTNSFYIIVFAPLAMVLAATAVSLLRLLGRWHWLLRSLGLMALGWLLAGTALFGFRYQINMINAQTTLVTPADVTALAWADANLPDEAVVGVNSWLWLGNTLAVPDGGAWLTPLTGRQATTPPADYIYNRDLFQQVSAYNDWATAVTDWRDTAVADRLRAEGVTHLFVGARGGFMDPAALAANPALRMVYGRDGVFIYAVLPE